MSWKSKPPTEKQLQLIKSLELDCGVEFTGKTRGEAYDYISARIDGPGMDNRATEYEEPWASEVDYYNWENESRNG